MGKDAKRHRVAIRAALERYRITSGVGFDLARFAPDDKPEGIPDKHDAQTHLEDGVAELSRLQETLYASAGWSLLLIFQAMDAAGKDSTIKHVMSGVNPQGVSVTSFKAPTSNERAHDFLWRSTLALPRRGMIGIFNRSYYEEVLVARVHPDILAGQNLPGRLADDPHIWRHRIADIAAYEAYLARQGTKVLKFFLNVSLDEQKARFLSRLDEPDKHWKFDAADLRERDAWPAYREAYQAAIAGTATKHAPWFVVPADRKWYMRLVVAEAIIDALTDLGLKTPELDKDQTKALAEARRLLENE